MIILDGNDEFLQLDSCLCPRWRLIICYLIAGSWTWRLEAGTVTVTLTAFGGLLDGVLALRFCVENWADRHFFLVKTRQTDMVCLLCKKLNFFLF